MELANEVRRMTGSHSEIELVSYDDAYEEGFEDMPRRIPDTAKIQGLLGWEPTKPLAQIISDVIDHQRGEAGLRRFGRRQGSSVRRRAPALS